MLSRVIPQPETSACSRQVLLTRQEAKAFVIEGSERQPGLPDRSILLRIVLVERASSAFPKAALCCWICCCSASSFDVLLCGDVVGCCWYWCDRSRDSSLLLSDRSSAATASRALVEDGVDEEEAVLLFDRAPR